MVSGAEATIIIEPSSSSSSSSSQQQQYRPQIHQPQPPTPSNYNAPIPGAAAAAVVAVAPAAASAPAPHQHQHHQQHPHHQQQHQQQQQPIPLSASTAWTQVVFEVEAKTGFGDSVCVVGSDKALGNWDLRRAVMLYTGDKTYPMWRSCTVYVLTGREMHYKLIIRRANGEVEWEQGDRNRRIVPTGGRLLLPHRFGVGVNALQTLVPLASAWSSIPPSFNRVNVPNGASGPSWRQNGRTAHVLFRRLRADGVEYLFEHRAETPGATWEDGVGQLCLPGGTKEDLDSDSRYTAFRRASETCLGSCLNKVGLGMLYEAFKFALVDLLTVSPAQGGYYVCDIDELTKGLNFVMESDWTGSEGVRTERDVDRSIFPTGCTWVPARVLKTIVDTRPCSYTQDVSRPCKVCVDCAENHFMLGIPIYGPLKRNLTRFRHKLWI